MIEKLPEILQIVFMVIGVAASIAAITPTPKDDDFIRKIRKALDVFGMNVGNAKNRD